MTLIARLDAVRARRNILEHPFYTRWERGDLTREELAAYAGEYRHAVVALAAVAVDAGPRGARPGGARPRLAVGRLCRRAGRRPRPGPTPETQRCASAWTAAADPLEALAILYAIEAGQPDVSETKLRGLVDHYGFEESGAGTAYFRLHATQDHEHAAESRELLERHGTPADEDRLVAAAEAALDGSWDLLDGVSS
jgi:pyrroloquinoline-quinone synthase